MNIAVRICMTRNYLICTLTEAVPIVRVFVGGDDRLRLFIAMIKKKPKLLSPIKITAKNDRSSSSAIKCEIFAKRSLQSDTIFKSKLIYYHCNLECICRKVLKLQDVLRSLG